MKKEEFECIECGENLKLNTEGVMTSKVTGESVNIYFCEECDQSYAFEDNRLKIMPFHADMKPIEEECLVCGTIRHFNQEVVFILKDDWKYYPYCFDCAYEFLRNWLREKKPENVNKITMENVKEIESVYDFEKTNELLVRDRDKITDTQNKFNRR